LYAGEEQEVIDAVGDRQIQPAFLYPVRGYCAAILTAVAGVDHHRNGSAVGGSKCG